MPHHPSRPHQPYQQLHALLAALADEQDVLASPIDLVMRLKITCGLVPEGPRFAEVIGLRPVLGVVRPVAGGPLYFKQFDLLSGCEADGEPITDYAEQLSRLEQFPFEELRDYYSRLPYLYQRQRPDLEFVRFATRADLGRGAPVPDSPMQEQT